MTTEPTVGGVSVAHIRLRELFRLADASKPFYSWLETVSRSVSPEHRTLNDFLLSADAALLYRFVGECQSRITGFGVPQVFDGIGRPYRPKKALYYYLSWLVRDAPQQRLQPLLAAAVRTGMKQAEAEARAFAALVCCYREDLQNFEWSSVREVVADRLEGSRRSLRGRAVEAAVRAVIAEALSDEVSSSGRYGRFDGAVMSEGEVLIDGHAFDVCIDLFVGDVLTERVVLPVKSRETQGGGHANLFTRDIEAAMASLQRFSVAEGIPARMAPVIVAENWHADQLSTVRSAADAVIVIDGNPNSMEALPDLAAEQVQEFVVAVLHGTL